MIDDYFREIEHAITDLPFVHNYVIEKDKRSLYIGFLTGIIQFVDGSELHFMEFADTRENTKRYKYSYHYQDAECRPVFRYDMAPHHRDITTNPHHKHVFLKSSQKVIESSAPLLSEVLLEIAGAIND